MIKITYTVSKLVNIEPREIIPKINDYLTKLEYKIVYSDENTISFIDSFWSIGSRTKGFKKVDGGKFQLMNLEKETQLNFSYYVSFAPVIYFAVFFILFSVIIDYHIIFLLLIVLLIHLLRIDNVKSIGEEMFKHILP